jgi:hypothetical protein
MAANTGSAQNQTSANATRAIMVHPVAEVKKCFNCKVRTTEKSEIDKFQTGLNFVLSGHET